MGCDARGLGKPKKLGSGRRDGVGLAGIRGSVVSALGEADSLLVCPPVGVDAAGRLSKISVNWFLKSASPADLAADFRRCLHA